MPPLLVFLSLSFDLEAKVEGVADLVARLKGEGRLLCVCVYVWGERE